jgi:hypothetical protein
MPPDPRVGVTGRDVDQSVFGDHRTDTLSNPVTTSKSDPAQMYYL